MNCTCVIEHTGELAATGCLVHPGENMRMAHRHGRAWKFSEEGAIGELTPKELWVGWVSILTVTITAVLSWLVWA